MAKDIRLIIGGDTRKAQAELEALQKAGRETAGQIEKDFVALGTKSSLAFEKKRQAAQSAYESIKSASNTTAGEIQRAEKALADRLVAIDTEQFGKRESLLAKFKANWIGATAAVGAAVASIAKAYNLAEEAAKGLQQRAAFTDLVASSGGNADALINDLKRISNETIATRQLVESAGTAMLLGVEEKMLPKLMEIAKASSRITGETTAKAFDDLSLAVARQSKMILDNLGIIIDVEAANKNYAAALGKTSDDLSDAEKKQAFLNATVAAGDEIINKIGTSTTSLSDRMQQASAKMDEMKERLGLIALGVGTALVGAFELGTSVMHASIGILTKWFSVLFEGASYLPIVGDYFEDFAKTLDNYSSAAFETSSEALNQATETFKSSMAAFRGLGGSVEPSGSGISQKKTLETIENEALETAKSIQDKRIKLFRDTAKDIIDVEKNRIKSQKELENKHLDSLKSDYERTVNELNALIDTKKEVGATFNELQKKNQASIVSDIPEMEYDKYLKAHDKFLEEEKKIDGTWADPNEKAKRYAELAKKYEAYNKAVVVDGQEVISGYEAQADAAEAIERLQRKTVDLIGEETEKRETAAVTMAEQMTEAENRLNAYANRVSELDNILRNLPKVVDVDINLNISNMSSLAQVLAAAGYRNFGDYYTMGGSTYWADGSLAASDTWAAGFDTGTKYVPKTGLYMLHRGETVKTRDETASSSGGNVTISAPINITMQGSSNNPEQTARELARLVEPQLRALAARYR